MKRHKAESQSNNGQLKGLTSRGIVIDLRSEEQNANDSMRRSGTSFSNEIDESDPQ
jgi:hypothetical protein